METANWEKVNISEIFKISYGNKLDLCDMTIKKNGIAFISRSSNNNGISGYVEKLENIEPYPANCLTIALGGSIGCTFLQKQPFYTAQNVAVLKPVESLPDAVLLVISTLIQKECEKRFVAFGRELNKHINKDFTIKLPFVNGKPDWSILENIVASSIIPKLPHRISNLFNGVKMNNPQSNNVLPLNIDTWQWFSLGDKKLFTIKGSKTTPLKELELSGRGDYPYITTQAKNNGVSGFYNMYTEKGGCFTIDSAVAGYCSWHEEDFSASDHVEKLIPNFPCNNYIAMFLTTIINLERYRYNYGLKCSQTRIKNMKVKLPVDSSGNPDWQYMEAYIKGLPYSSNL